MEVLVMLMALILIPMLFVMAVRFNRYLVILLPLVLFALFVIWKYDLLVRLAVIFLKYCLIWVLLALAVSFPVSRKWKRPARIVFSAAICLIACIIPVAVSGCRTGVPFPEEEWQTHTITEATAYRHQGDAVQLGEEEISEFQMMMSEVAVRKDLLEKSRDMTLDRSHLWYCVDAVLSDGQTVCFSFFPQDEEPDLMRVERDGVSVCYQALNRSDDLGGDWVNGRISEERRKSVLSKYTETLRALKESFFMDGTICTFTVPEGFPADVEITNIGLPDERNAVIYFLEEHNEAHDWTAGKTYSFDVSEYGSYRYIYLSVKTDGENFHLVNIFELLPEEWKSRDPQDRFFDAGI